MSGTKTNSAVKVTVSARAAKRVRSGHPWVYRTDLPETSKETPRAALVQVVDERGRLLGSALSSSTSQIALRMISAEPLEESALPGLLRERVRAAIAYRTKFVRDSDACRLVFSEADGLPGLIVDKYANVVTFHALTQAMAREDLRTAYLDELKAQFGVETKEINIVERAETRIRQLED